MSDAAGTPLDPTILSGERRQVTVLFADMVGFMSISERLGEEGTFALIQPIYALMSAAVKESGGFVKDFAGDGIMALFGAPEALEDAPLRACRAALAIHERLAAAVSFIEALHGVRPQMRVGINSGLAVITHIGGEGGPVTAIGDTVNLASRLQALAEPGTTYLSEATQRLVQGLVDSALAGEQTIKGKTESQKVYRLNGLRQGATRFDAAVGLGLSTYVGRERELDLLDRALAEARAGLRVIDIVAEPGMGKSRLLYEFRQRVADKQSFILAGSCSPDGQQTPFLPFIEIVRGSFRVCAGEDEIVVARQLALGLDALGLRSPENLGLLINLLGLKPPDGLLAGLDGVLIGLRTRDLLHNLLEARCRLSQVVMLIEDLHWADSGSQEVLDRIIEGSANSGLIVLHTRRPEYEPSWRNKPDVTTLLLEPLPAGDIRRLIQLRLGVDALPESLARQVIEKAEGNALFAEEILSFLTERGALRIIDGNVEFGDAAAPAALPASLQSLLTARVDRLAPKDRGLLQAAAVIGRRFNPQLLAVVADAEDVEARLAGMHGLDLVRPDGVSGEYLFKHALVRDALYQSLLTRARAVLHLKIAEEIERRSGNRLSEVVETLAHHYSQTERRAKAFAFLAMAGAKSLGVYSLDEADKAFASALSILDTTPECATEEQIANFLVDYTSFSNLMMRQNTTKRTVERFMPKLDRLDDHPTSMLVQHHYVLALLVMNRFAEAAEAQARLSAAAARIEDRRLRAYAIVSAIHVSTHAVPYPIVEFDAACGEAISAASSIDEASLRNSALSIVAWAEFHRGRMNKAHEIAERLRALGTRMNDPRSLGLAMHNRSWAALFSDDYSTGLKFAESCLNMARSPYDQQSAETARAVALALLKHPDGLRLLGERMALCATNDWRQHLSGLDGVYGVAMVLNGNIGGGIRWLEQSILRREQEGYRVCADWFRLFLCEVYLEVISGKEKPPINVLFRNIMTLAKVMFTAEKRILALVERVRQNPHFDPNGHMIGRVEMILGLLFKIRKKQVLAAEHLSEAERIISQFGPTPMLAKIEAALAELC